jgi:hypothetical protein
MIRFLASEIKPAAFLFGSVSLSAVRKRNEQSNSAAKKPPCEREMNMSNQGGPKTPLNNPIKRVSIILITSDRESNLSD